MHETREIAVGVYWVGVRDWERRLFDALIPMPAGTTYNSYLVSGRDKVALIDTVNPGFEEELKGKLEQLGSWGRIDYLIMNHAEPDHAGNIAFVLEHNPRAKLVLTAKGAKLAKVLFHVSEDRMKVVQDGETLGLGGRSLRFIEAPFLHWPETMFTYLEEEKVLFPCDFFGSHHAGGAFADEVPDLLTYAKKYFGEIMMPYAKNGRNGLAKLEGLDIRMIAPSHGPIHRDPGPIVDAYLSWTSGETVPKVTICYATMWQATKALVDEFAQTLMQEGVDAKVYDLAVSDLASIAGDLVDSRGIVLAGPTVLNGLHPLALHAANVVKAIKPPAKYAVLLSSYGWGGGAVKQALEVLAPLKLDALGAIDVNGYPTKEDLKKTEDLARMMAQRVKEPVD